MESSGKELAKLEQGGDKNLQKLTDKIYFSACREYMKVYLFIVEKL